MPERILLVDDEEIILETVGDDLREAGYEVSEARNGVEGLRRFRENQFDMVICDLVMDEMDGFGVLKEVKRISPDTPVIIITGYPSSKAAKEALMLGASEIVVKPSGLGELFQTIRLHLGPEEVF